ncbi:hypothetical protein Rhe02_38590 [Rhizocola hellebori]|uniref:ARB-07466-like C-terminal domain-containing protein n=1 Tax=Rhizocola hellebori TaxID=1392758 RepID=A0A8J3Q9G7_9ACTN|nr:hypothetical protein [Rhizocola hellebori]GIH05792.1 hypothetical protein Rhe02_38590 [Rhizocola hellebori]
MTLKVPLRPRRSIAPALIAVFALVLGLATPAAAEPAPTAPPNEGGTPTVVTLRANLEAAAAGFIEAENQLNASKAKQAEYEAQLRSAEAEMARVRGGVAKYATEAYKTGRLGVISMMLSSSTTDAFLDRARAIDMMTQRDQGSLNTYLAAKKNATDSKIAIEAQIAEQAAATAEMQKRKTAAEKALAAAGGTATRTNVDWATLPTARPAPRNSDGTWPSETCSEDDPTPADGCITPRTLYMLNETHRLGWNWYVSCYRPGDKYEHPKGRACDWAAYPTGFVDKSAKDANKVYGDRLAEFFAKNASALGVMYVVWYCQIWQVGVGWHRYNSTGSKCGDSPAGDHTNHVHVSIY